MSIVSESIRIGSIEVIHTYSSIGAKIRKHGTDKDAEEAVDVIDSANPVYPVYEESVTYTDEQAQDAAQVVTSLFGGPISLERGAAIRDAITSSQTDEQAAATPELYYGGVLYKCLQAHTGQSDWTPTAAPSLWAKVLVETDEHGQQTAIKEWEQPDSTNPYSKGDKVTYKGKTYESSIDSNVWSPEAYPAGWTEVTA